jgi:putative (di)nucleoside polyphosphate hydrolase
MSKAYRLGIGIVLINQEGKILIGKRFDSHDDYPAWQMPQGGIDGKEAPKEAMYREAMEEIGTNNFKIIAESANWLSYDFPEEFIKMAYNGMFVGQKQKWFLLKFLGTDSEININTENREFTDWKWIDISDLEGIIIDFKKPLYANIVKEFKPLIPSASK